MSEADNAANDWSESDEPPDSTQIAASNIIVARSIADRKVRRRRRRRTNWPFVGLLLALFIGWLAYTFVLPDIEIAFRRFVSPKKSIPAELELNFSNRMMFRTCEFLYVFWFFYLGASIGSFINVVASRTPRGQTIVTEGSRCPFCYHHLNFFENMPIFGWIRLRGRCKACHLPIASRYLFIEIIVGLIFMAFSIIELINNGENLPYHHQWYFGRGIVETVFFPKWDLIAGYAVHCACFATIVMLIATHLDGLRFPAIPIMCLALLICFAQIALPVLVPVYWNQPFVPRSSTSTLEQRLGTSWLGGIIGVLLGFVMSRFVLHLTSKRVKPDTENFVTIENSSSADNSSADENSSSAENNPGDVNHATSDRSHLPVHLACIIGLSGVLFGWQAIVVVTLVSSVICMFALPKLSMSFTEDNSNRSKLKLEVIALAIWASTLVLHHAFWRQVTWGLGI